MALSLGEVLRSNVISHLGDRPQSWLAKEAGINQGSLSQFLRGAGNPSVETIEAMAKALKVPAAALLGGSSEKNYLIPEDILKLLDGQSPEVFATIRSLLKMIESERSRASTKK